MGSSMIKSRLRNVASTSRTTGLASLILLGASVTTGLGCQGQTRNSSAEVIDRQRAISQTDVVVSEVSFASGSDDVPAILTGPARAGQFPSVVIIHANSLREPYIGETATLLAKGGFVAIAVDVFHFLPRVAWKEYQQLPGELIRSRLDAEFREDRLVRNIQSAIEFLRALALVRPGGVGLIGFCGGGWNGLLVAAQSADVTAVVAFYAPVALADSTRRSPHSLADFITVPVQYHRAADDPAIPAVDVERFAAALRLAGTDIEVFTYQARHGFIATNRAQCVRRCGGGVGMVQSAAVFAAACRQSGQGATNGTTVATTCDARRRDGFVGRAGPLATAWLTLTAWMRLPNKPLQLSSGANKLGALRSLFLTPLAAERQAVGQTRNGAQCKT